MFGLWNALIEVETICYASTLERGPLVWCSSNVRWRHFVRVRQSVMENAMSGLRFLVVFLVVTPVIWAENPGAPAVENSAAYTLKYQFPEGESLHYLLREKSNIHQQYQGGEQKSENDSSLEKHYRVVETREDGSAVLEVVTDYVKLKYSFADAEPVEYDSRSDEEPPEPLKSLRNKVGKPVARAEFSVSGQLLSLTELSEGSVPVDSEDLGRKNFLIELPQDPIAVGGTWKQSYSIELLVAPRLNRKFTISHLYKLQKVEEGVAEISFSSIITPRLVAPDLRAKLIQDLPSGTILFDLDAGRIVSQVRRVDRTELGVGGPKTALTINSLKVEKLIDSTQSVSQKSP